MKNAKTKRILRHFIEKRSRQTFIFMLELLCLFKKEDLIMAKNLSNRSANIKNIRSKSLRATKKEQRLNLQVVTLDNGTKARLSTKEARTLKKAN